MLEYFVIWALLVTSILIVWHLVQDERQKVREERRKRAIQAAEILKREPVQYTTITPEDLLFILEISEANHDG
jgi:hypothetical protein